MESVLNENILNTWYFIDQQKTVGVVTCCHEGRFPGQQPVLGGSDQLGEVFPAGGQLFYLVLHCGEYLKGKRRVTVCGIYTRD